MTSRSIRCAIVVFVAAAVYCLVPRVPGGGTAERDGHERRYDRPGDAEAFFYGQRLYPDGRVPDFWREQALSHIRAMRAASMGKSQADWAWISLGPENIAGRVRAMAIDPTDASIVYAGSAGGGVWKSTNAGATWIPLDDFLPNLRIGSIAVQPADHNTIFAGCGEGFVNWQGGKAFGRGIYRSSDAGATWALIPSTATPDFEFVFDIAFDPFDPGIVIAATKAGLMRSTDAGTSWTAPPLPASGCRGMMTVFGTQTPGLAYAALEGYGVMRSVDHGATWTTRLITGITPAQFQRVQIAAAPSNENLVYAAFTAPDGDCAAIYRTTDRGNHWTAARMPESEVTGDNYMRRQGWYNSVLAVHPSNPSVVWAGGIDLYRSTDAGATWKQMTNWFSYAGYAYVHADQHALLFDPRSPSRMYAGCDGGVFRTTNGGASFIDANSGLVTTQFHSATPHPTSDLVLGGTIDNGNLRVLSDRRWGDVTGGDGGCTAIDPSDTRIMYAELYSLAFSKSTMYGVAGSFVEKMNGIPHHAGDIGTSDRCAFIAPFVMQTTNPRCLYAGTYRLYRTTDGAELWTPVSPDLSGGGYLTAIGLAPGSGRIVYTGASTGVVYVTSDSCGTWTKGGAGLPQRYVTDIAVDRASAAIAYLTVSGFGSGHVFRTTDLGATWSDLSGTGASALPDVPANTIAVHPTNPMRLFVGTDVGLFTSFDGGDTWVPATQGMGNVTIADITFRTDGTLFVATHGRGVFRSATSLLDTQRLQPSPGFIVGPGYPNPATSITSSSFIVPFTLGARNTIAIRVYDIRGRVMLVKQLIGDAPAGNYQLPVDLSSLPTGVYMFRMDAGNLRSDPQKIVILK